ncbi:hypothetical protein B0I35DRAFT_516441 [Stachybotrys elegans]|uniref:NAD(P)-binding domain-containing protein n=1 Tax=Stachybotrys elegans TaxID=80388 RepID=A0A8K0SFR1_9HYPO|nr:hypothetical protein B0I35DRAFT_516441 [Stachybotrys elegans]
MTSSKKTIACFGATGGCVGAALAHALKNDHHCTALARDPQKLRHALTNEHDVPASTIEQLLTIVEGDVKDTTAVTRALISPSNPDAIVDIILSGIGAYPTFQFSIRQPFPLTDPTISETAIQTIFQVLSGLYAASKPDFPSGKAVEKPLLVAISTAGCGRRRSVPLSIYLPYHYFLGSPLADKKRMEALIQRDYAAHVRDFVIMRPLFLTEGEAKGDGAIRIGWEWGVESIKPNVNEPGPAIGYSISKKDVGLWIFTNLVTQSGWEGKCVYTVY